MEPAPLEDRLCEFVERRERGEELSPEDFARESGGGEELLAALRALAATEALFPSGPPDLPARVGRYRVRGEIGRGGMGRVLEATHPDRPGLAIALKLLHVSVEHQPRALERFRREGRALERIAHPNVVRVLEAGLLDDRPFLAMEKVEGTSLAELVRRARERAAGMGRRLPVDALELPGTGDPLERAVRLVARLARALAAAHREGVLHRDVNPRNVLVRPDGEPVLIDFGLMRASGDPTLTGSGDLLGTPQYMPPEQARGTRVDERSDVFGLGTVLSELVTLAPPRAGADTLALLREASNRPLRGPRRLAPALPRELSAVIQRATAFFPRWRTPSCEALAADLERWLEGEPVQARAPGPLVRACEAAQAHRRAFAVGALLALSLAVLALLRRGPALDPHERAARATTAVVLPWLDGDLAGARAELASLRAAGEEPPFAEFLDALAHDDLARESDDPATRALLEGERLRRAGDPAGALVRFSTAWDLAPGFPAVLLFQGLAALEAGKPQGARGALEASASSFGASVELHRRLARLYAELGLHADAARALEAVLALAPDDAAASLALSSARERLAAAPAAPPR